MKKANKKYSNLDDNNRTNNSNVENPSSKTSSEKIIKKESEAPEIKTNTSPTERVETKEGKKIPEKYS